uniref:Uncharacterized protein MANES_04G105600 n=1 Tax=Rhizophora mucronata TaxID=61149 RepID=A0A2P2NGT8_RHIMU
MGENKPADLPEECWELIFRSINHRSHLEFLSSVSTRFLRITNQLRRTLAVSSASAAFLPSLLRRFPNIKDIQIRDFEGDLNSLLSQISNSGLDLESLDISHQTHFPLLGLKELGSRMSHLRKLNCSKMGSLLDSDLFAIGSSFPSLEVLDIGFPQHASRLNPVGSSHSQSFSGVVTDDGVVDLSMKLGKLRKIDISGNHFVTDKSLLALSLNCVLLSEILIRDCDFITQNGIGLAMRNAVNLTSISLDGIGIPSIDSFLEESFPHAKSLCELDLSNSFISDELLCLVAQACLPLNKLKISQCYNFSFAGIHCLLNGYQFLVYLDLEGANFLDDQSIVELSKFLCNLTFVNLSLCSKLTSYAFFTLMRNCPLLEEIRMERTNLGVEEFTTDFVVNGHVKSLNLAGNNFLDDGCIKEIALCCPNMQVLNISYCPTITEEGIGEVLGNCREIRHLEMNRCVGIKNLDIEFELPKLENLQAQSPGIDDEALAKIANKCPMLLHLNLDGCLSVTAEGVNQVVQNCRKLREISLKWCDNVRVDIIAFWVFARPSLRKIVPPCGFIPTNNQMNFFLRHGCLVCKG